MVVGRLVGFRVSGWLLVKCMEEEKAIEDVERERR